MSKRVKNAAKVLLMILDNLGGDTQLLKDAKDNLPPAVFEKALAKAQNQLEYKAWQRLSPEQRLAFMKLDDEEVK